MTVKKTRSDKATFFNMPKQGPTLKIVRTTSQLIHSADPQSRPVMIIAFTYVIRPSVRPSPLFKMQQSKTNFQGKQCALLVEWIINDTCLVGYCFCDARFYLYLLANFGPLETLLRAVIIVGPGLAQAFHTHINNATVAPFCKRLFTFRHYSV